MSEIIETVSAAPTLQPKTKLSGKVIKTTLAGALLDVGQNVPGVLHISQIQKEAVNKVEDVLKVGQSVDVWVRRARKDRIELTMIEPLGMEWSEIKPDVTVKGKVVRLETYGAFVDFGAERPGMVHVSELTRGYVKSPGEVVKEGDEIEAVVLDVDRKKKQIKLSMKALMPEMIEEEKPEREHKKTRGKRGKKHEEEMVEIEETSKEPELTAMQIAWQMAMERSDNKGKTVKIKPVKSASREQEDILSRTLEKQVPTGV
ncbi:MAG: Polyribonucleotide nucleotidyltransferase [Anaerolineales bacterium]|nr:Polyribonucleotide nucleotidyltransferase [Anaerolineales bacterium]